MAIDFKTKLQLYKTDPQLADALAGQIVQAEDDFLGLSLAQDYLKYTKMLRDARVRSLLKKRRDAVLGRKVTPRGDDTRKVNVEAIKKAQIILDRCRFESLCSSLMRTGMLMGFAVAQKDYVVDPGSKLVIPKFTYIPQRRWTFVVPEDDAPTATGKPLGPGEYLEVNGYEMRLLTQAHPYKGERVPKSRFIVYGFDNEHSPWGLGLGYTLYPSYSIKKESWKAWLLHSDRTGSPPPYGTTPEGFDEELPENKILIRKFDDFLEALSPDHWGRFPADFAVKYLTDGIGGAAIHADLIGLCDAQMSMAVLGEVAFSDKATGSYAANESQIADRETTLTDADCNLLDEQLDAQLWREIQFLNYREADRVEVRRETIADKREQESDLADLGIKRQQADLDVVLIAEMGLTPSAKYIQETYGDHWTVPSSGDANPLAPPIEPVSSLPPAVIEQPTDFAEPPGRYVYWKGLTIAIENEPFTERIGKQLKIPYGHIQGYIGSDGMAIDCYLGPNLDSDKIFRVTQLTKDGQFDEHKFMLHFADSNQAIAAYKKQTYPGMFGGCDEITIGHLSEYAKPVKVIPAAFAESELLSDQQWDELARIDDADIRSAMNAMAFAVDESQSRPIEYAEIDFTIPSAVQKAAKEALKLRKQFGRGGTKVGLNTAKILAAGGTITPRKARHINLYFPRHEVDKQGKDWANDEMPSNGKIAWLLWGGDAAWAWTNKLLKQMADFEEARDFSSAQDGGGYWRDAAGRFADPGSSTTAIVDHISSSTALQAHAAKSSLFAAGIAKVKELSAPALAKLNDQLEQNPTLAEDIGVVAIAMAGQFALMPSADPGTAALLQSSIGVAARSGLQIKKRIVAELKLDSAALKSISGVMAVSKKLLSDFQQPDVQEKLIGDALGPALGTSANLAAGGGVAGMVAGTVAGVAGTPIAAAKIQKTRNPK